MEVDLEPIGLLLRGLRGMRGLMPSPRPGGTTLVRLVNANESCRSSTDWASRFSTASNHSGSGSLSNGSYCTGAGLQGLGLSSLNLGFALGSLDFGVFGKGERYELEAWIMDASNWRDLYILDMVAWIWGFYGGENGLGMYWKHGLWRHEFGLEGLNWIR